MIIGIIRIFEDNLGNFDTSLTMITGIIRIIRIIMVIWIFKVSTIYVPRLLDMIKIDLI